MSDDSSDITCTFNIWAKLNFENFERVEKFEFLTKKLPFVGLLNIYNLNLVDWDRRYQKRKKNVSINFEVIAG